MKKIVLILAVLVVATFAAVDPPTNILLRYDNNFAQLGNIKTALDALAWPHTDFVGQTFPAFWTALNNGTAWDFVIMDDLYYRDTTASNYDQLVTYATAHPNCRVMFADWYMQNYTSIWSFFDVNACTSISSTIPAAYAWDPTSPCFTGLTPPPVGTNPGLGTVGHRLGWVAAAKATTDVPLGYAATSTQGQGAWVFSKRQGTEAWRRPHTLMMGFSMGMNSTNGVDYYKNILKYMWEEENPAAKVTTTSLGNIKATYR